MKSLVIHITETLCKLKDSCACMYILVLPVTMA